MTDTPSRIRRRLTLGVTLVLFVLMLVSVLSPDTAQAESPRASGAVIPPPGGVTIVRAGSNGLGAIVQSAPFAVEAIYAFDIATQRFVSFAPGAPTFVNTLQPSHLTPDTLVWLKRPRNDRESDVGTHLSSPATTGPHTLPPPITGGLTVGTVGTTSLSAFLGAQKFSVESLWLFDVASQRYLTHHVGKPSFVNTLDMDGQVVPTTVVFLRRSSEDVTPLVADSQPPLAVANPMVTVSIPSGSPAPASIPAVTPTSTPTAAPTATPTAAATPAPDVQFAGAPSAPSSTSNEGCPTIPQDRLALLNERVGFGRNAEGGAQGCQYVVTNLKDSGAGSLREGATQGDRWVVFAVSGTINLSSPIDVASNTTIDGRGESILIRGNGLYMLEKQNVVISHLSISGSDDDGIQIRRQSTRDIWVNHVTINDVADGYIDITQGATNVTVSWSRFDPSPSRAREKVMLIGANDPGDRDELTNVTLHHNYFNSTQQRNPLIRAGYVHSYNNYITRWDIYGTGVGAGGRLLSERNIYDYDGGHRARAFGAWDDGDANIRSAGDSFLSGASGEEFNASSVAAPPYSYNAATPNDALRSQITAQAGNR